MTTDRTSPGSELLDEYAEDGFVFPAYGDRCFADVPESALSLLSKEFERGLPNDALEGLEGVDRVVTLVVDGLGLDQWTRLAETLPLFGAFESAGTVTPLTSVYPSETAAAITTLHTGLLPAEHGLLGWHQYFEQVDESIQTLPFLLEDGTPVHDEYPDANPRDLFDGDSIYPRAETAGVATHVVQPEKLIGSESSTLFSAGATSHGYWNVADAAVRVRQLLESVAGPTHVSLYVPNVDSISHVVGTATDRYDAQVRMIADCLRHELVDALDPDVAEETALLLTADHGHTNVDQSERVDLDDPRVWELLARRPGGEPIPPVGGPRNVQFHVRDGREDELRAHLEEEADVLTLPRAEYRDRGLFGESHVDPGDTFERRAPDVVAVHRETVMWYESDDKVGVHGGMTPEEMLVPLATGRISDLQS